MDKFHKDLQYLFDNIFSKYTDLIPMYGNHPIIFLFGGGLTADQFTGMSERKYNFAVIALMKFYSNHQLYQGSVPCRIKTIFAVPATTLIKFLCNLLI